MLVGPNSKKGSGDNIDLSAASAERPDKPESNVSVDWDAVLGPAVPKQQQNAREVAEQGAKKESSTTFRGGIGFDPPTEGNPANPNPPAEANTARAARPPAAPQPAEPKQVTAAEVWDDIRRQSEQKKAEFNRLQGMKQGLLEEDRREAEQRSIERIRQAAFQADAERARYRADLQRVLTRWGDDAAPEIKRLTERYMYDTQPEIEDGARDLLNRVSGKYRRQDRLNILRMAGMPEPRVLDYLTRLELKNLYGRNGPRNDDDALIRAARTLLASPLPPPRPAPKPPATVPTAVVAPPAPAPSPGPKADRKRSP
jgi:hypothetical protein